MKYFFFLFLVSFLACQQRAPDKIFPSPTVPNSLKGESTISLSREEYYDKVLGMLVGSALGDAMGAPTEMWDRKSIAIQKGYVDNLDEVIRERSPEGPWETNMPAGSTTDDTRWKYLGIQYLITQRQDSLNPQEFAKHIIDVYQSQISEVGKSSEYEKINRAFAQATWLIEWVKVAKPFLNNNLIEYNEKLSRFMGVK